MIFILLENLIIVFSFQVNSDDDESTQKQHQHLISTQDTLNRSISMSDNSSIPTKSSENSFEPTLHSPTNLSSRSITPVGRKSVLARAELWDRRIIINENETNDIIPTYDIEQWSNEFEKIQNQN